MVFESLHERIRAFDGSVTVDWFSRQAWVFIPISLLYVGLIFVGQRFMANRQKYNLKWPLTLWSTTNAIFSILGTYNTMPIFLNFFRKEGMSGIACNADIYNGVFGFWFLMSVASKFTDLFDTMFIVLRKQKLIFLHWYHHVATFLYTMFTYAASPCAPCKYYFTINFFVHAVMYSYYAVTASKLVRVPRVVSIFITFLQILQMIGGVYINCYVMLSVSRGESCESAFWNAFVCLMIYSSYLVLFSNFFVQSYFKKTPDSKSSDRAKHAKKV